MLQVTPHTWSISPPRWRILCAGEIEWHPNCALFANHLYSILALNEATGIRHITGFLKVNCVRITWAKTMTVLGFPPSFWWERFIAIFLHGEFRFGVLVKEDKIWFYVKCSMYTRLSILLIKGCSVVQKLRVRCDARVELATLFPISLPCILLKEYGEGVIYLQISEMLSFLLGKGGSTSTLDCVYHCK